MTSPWQEWKRKNLEAQKSGKVSPVDFLNPQTEYVLDELAQSRLAICNDCEHYMITKQCSRCGCFMPAKVTLKHSNCPEGKWGQALD